MNATTYTDRIAEAIKGLDASDTAMLSTWTTVAAVVREAVESEDYASAAAFTKSDAFLNAFPKASNAIRVTAAHWKHASATLNGFAKRGIPTTRATAGLFALCLRAQKTATMGLKSDALNAGLDVVQGLMAEGVKAGDAAERVRIDLQTAADTNQSNAKRAAKRAATPQSDTDPGSESEAERSESKAAKAEASDSATLDAAQAAAYLNAILKAAESGAFEPSDAAGLAKQVGHVRTALIAASKA